MPEGDTIHRAARTLHTALSGQRVERFESVLAHLTRVDADTPIAGRVIERVEARGKHLLMWLEGGLVLRTHMRMHGSWHIWPTSATRIHQLRLARDSISLPRFAGRSSRGKWQRRHDIRIVIETASYVAAAIAVPVAEFVDAATIDREGPVAELGPDLLSDTFDAADAVARIQARGDAEIADALLDQRAIAGIGNVFKSEILFAARVSPFTPVRALAAEQLARIVAIAERQMRANVGDADTVAAAGGRRTTNRLDPTARLWVYGRSGLPCRRCGSAIQRARQGPDARSTYWCERCQPRVA
ncbi:MAG TPA: DNA-formamidopyrimidine glycosylase family protein [Vicinamibacterales bacterium]|nr:DNA-formamidopyrimidine glycosylase family protein [Vicinamibacterales bacterium]